MIEEKKWKIGGEKKERKDLKIGRKKKEEIIIKYRNIKKIEWLRKGETKKRWMRRQREREDKNNKTYQWETKRVNGKPWR